MKVFQIVEENMMRKLPIRGKRLPTFYPSAASCRDEDDPTGTASGIQKETVHGGCMRAQWFRCAGYSESNPSTAYNQYIFAAGNMWEDWLTNQLKEAGVWLANSVKFAIEEYYISGEIDILAKDEDGSPVIIENKTYNASNYQAKKSICGLAGERPMPKEQNAMQAALYLTYFSKPENGGVKKVILTYMDRSCSDPNAYREFIITLDPDPNGKTYILVNTTDIKGTPYTYRMPGITIEGIFDRYRELMESLQASLETPPAPDFMHVYPPELVEQKYEAGEIAKTNYEKWRGNPQKYPLGHYMCRAYCNYRDLCKSYKDIDGHN